MTHDELLAIIDERISYLGNTDNVYIALRAVVELHKPSEYEPGQCWACSAYADNQYEADYPCWTIQAIEKELG